MTSLFLVGGSEGCSSGSGGNGGAAADGSTCAVYVPPTSFDPSSPAVSFTGEVLPIFAASCAFTSCHGSATGAQAGLYLGADGAKTYANLVGVSATDLPSMNRIAAGDPASSFLLHRVDDDACSLASCTTEACTELMPQGGPALAESKRLTLRAWIAQGALSDVAGDAGPGDAGATDASGGGD